MTHTPGPWKVVPYSGKSHDGYYAAGAHHRIFQLKDNPRMTVCLADVTAHRPGDTSLANARLIAAAPDLLAALRSARAALGITDTSEPIDVDAAVVRRIEAAIAKATKAED